MSDTMTTKDIAERLVELCRAGENGRAIDELYADHIISLEVAEPMKEVHGIEGVRGKNAWWIENHDVHGRTVEGPFVNGDEFAVRYTFEITPKASGTPISMDEVAVYVVSDGKIVQEKFYY
jgi:hypothetical protein